MIKLGTNNIGTVYLGSDKIGKAYLGSNLVFQSGSSPAPPLPYTPVEYIVTDGNCYIITRNTYAATPPKSSEIKVQMGSNTSCSLIAGFTVSSGSDSKNFSLANYYVSKVAAFSYYANYGSSDGMPSVSYSIDNDLPFIVKTDIKKGTQHISVKQENSDSWNTVTKSNNNTVSSTYLFAILGAYSNNQYEKLAPSGTRLYYCKIWDDETFTTLLFDGIPCVYNGEYGLWDRVSDSFYGNSGSGTFSGPSNS